MLRGLALVLLPLLLVALPPTSTASTVCVDPAHAAGFSPTTPADGCDYARTGERCLAAVDVLGGPGAAVSCGWICGLSVGETCYFWLYDPLAPRVDLP